MLVGVQCFIHADPCERRFSPKSLQEIVRGGAFSKFGLNRSAVRSNDLMGGLSIRTVPHRRHQQRFRGQEGHLSHQVGAAYRWVGDETLCHISQDAQSCVGRQKSLGQSQSPVGRIVKGPFEPLGGGRLVRVWHQVHHKSCQTTGPLASHGVAFVGHGGRANLLLGDGFFDFSSTREQTNIGGPLVAGGSDDAQRAENLRVHQPWVRLPSHRVQLFGRESHAFGHELFQLVHFVVITIKQREERCLGAGGAFDTTKADAIPLAFHFFEGQAQVPTPHAGPLAHGCGLRGLEMG